ncbi:hypothetical protein BZA70DRAFT_275949 [Myxozyma melibiosi]|uniref:arginine--tRNA ligase n=1 Tax=Myxozyma melibiosi TaxID=54550 RepID=A0ABR1F8M4_9ASCO
MRLLTTALRRRSPAFFPRPPFSFFRKMSSDVDALADRVQALGFGKPALLNIPGQAGPLNLASNPVDLFRAHITALLHPVTGVAPEIIAPALETTLLPERGDFVLAVPRLRVKGAKPDELAEKWASAFPASDLLSKVVAKGHFVQFFFNPLVLYRMTIPQILEPNSTFGNSTVGNGKRIIVEFSSPNIAKPFHAGHLRSTIIGGFISSLHERLGYEVVRINYLGDWGKQFGLLAVGFRSFGSETELESDPINHLFRVYVTVNSAHSAEKELADALALIDTSNTSLEASDISDEARAELTKKRDEAQASIPALTKAAIDAALVLDPNHPLKDELDTEYFRERPIDTEAKAYFKAMEDGDEAALALWKRFRELSISKYTKTYERLNIRYTEYSGESQISNESMQFVIDLLEKKNLLYVDRGAKLIDFKPYAKKLGKALIQKSDGTSLYLTRDLGAALERYNKYKFDKMIYVVASQQDLHLAQLFKLMELCDFPWAKNMQHVNFGMVQGMSTRKGTVVFLDTILEETKQAMHEVMKKNEAKYDQVENPDEVADLVGISAVMIQDMAAKRVNNYKFDWSRMLSFEGDTGPYLQYAHSRLCSVERRAGFSREQLINANFDLLTEPIAQELMRILAQYPDVLLNAARTSEPSTVVSFLFKLTHTVSSCYNILWVAGQEEELAIARLALYSSAREVLNRGMILLGLTPVERM